MATLSFSPGEGTGYPTPVFFCFPGYSDGKESACNVRDLGSIPGWEHPLEKGMATNSSILAWRIPMVSRAWQATIHGVAKNRTRLSDEAHTCILFIFKCSQIQKISLCSWVWVRIQAKNTHYVIMFFRLFLMGKSHGQRSLVTTVHEVVKELDTTLWLNNSVEWSSYSFSCCWLVEKPASSVLRNSEFVTFLPVVSCNLLLYLQYYL